MDGCPALHFTELSIVREGNSMLIDYLQTLYNYNYWANEHILRTAEQVSVAQLDTLTQNDRGSLRGTLVHILGAEWVWRSRWEGVSPTELLNEKDFPTLEALRTRWREEEQQMRAFLATLQEEGLTRIVQYKNTRGQAFAAPLWLLMAHLITHGTQHRSEVAMILTELGHSPGELDLLEFLPVTMK